MESGGNMLSLQIEGMPWERIKHVSVDREGESIIALRPKLDKVAHRLLCDVKLVDNVKVVTFRSAFNIENRTMVPVEVVVLDAEGELSSVIRHMNPGEDCPVPIEAAYHNRIRLRPDRECPADGGAGRVLTHHRSRLRVQVVLRERGLAGPRQALDLHPHVRGQRQRRGTVPLPVLHDLRQAGPDEPRVPAAGAASARARRSRESAAVRHPVPHL